MVPVSRHPDAGLLEPCVDPVLSNPDTATDNDFAADQVRLADAYLACKVRHQKLIDFEKAGNGR